MRPLFAILLLAMALPAGSARAQAPPYLFSWGSLGTGDGEFNLCVDAAVDASGRVYVTDMLNQRVQVFSGDGTFLFKWGAYGQNAGEFQNPYAIDLDADGNVYVLEQIGNRVQKFSESGEFVLMWGADGSLPGEFSLPTGIAVGPGGTVYVADNGNGRVQRFTAGGDFMSEWSQTGLVYDYMAPRGVAVTETGEVFVTDVLFGRLLKFTQDGTPLGGWGGPGGGGPPLLEYPWGIESRFGTVVVGDYSYNRVRAFDTGGNHLWDILGSDLGLTICPTGVAVGPDASLYVVDYCNGGRVLKFGPIPVQTRASTWGRTKSIYR